MYFIDLKKYICVRDLKFILLEKYVGACSWQFWYKTFLSFTTSNGHVPITFHGVRACSGANND